MTNRQSPASVGQRLLWFLDRYRGQTGALNCPMVCRLRGAVDEVALQRALDGLAAQHESLRTTFVGGGRDLVQVVHEPGPVELRRVELRGEADPEAALAAALAADLRTPTDPRVAAVRATLWQTDDEERVLALTMHHLVTDTWSCDVLFADLADGYGREVGDSAAASAQPPGWQYTQFTNWQDRQFRSEAFSRHREYWQHQLADLRLPALPVRADATPGGGQRVSEHGAVPIDVGERLRELARVERTTTFAVLLAVYYALLHQRTGTDDLAVSTLFANRTRPELQRTVGFLANMVVLRTRLPEQATFVDVVRQTRQTVIDAFAHQEMPYHILAQRTERSAGGLRADDLVFQQLAEALDGTICAGGVQFQGVVPDVVGRFDLELALMPRDGGYAVKLYYTADRVDPGWAADFVAGYTAIAAAATTTPNAPIADLAPVV